MPNAFDNLGSSEPYVPDYLQDEIQFRIDNDLRTIAIPADGVVLGVVGDKNVNHVNFQMPAWYNGFDMSTFQARINFIDAGGNANYYTVTDMTVMTPEGIEVEGTPGENDIIYFTWLVDSYATGYIGQVRFNVRLTKHDTSVNPAVLSQAFNTQINSCQVLEGIQLADEITQEQAEDLLFHYSSELGDITEGYKHDIEEKVAAALDSIPDGYVAVPERKIKATLWPNNMTSEEFYTQLDRFIDDGFTDFILPIHLAYDDTLTLYVSTTIDYEEIISYIEEHGCRVYCLKFHMRAQEFNKKDNSVSIVEYREKIAEIVNEYADKIEMCTVFNEIHSIVKANKTAVRDTIIRLKSTGVKVAITFSAYEFTSNENDDIINFSDAVCVNWYPAVSWVRYPELPTPDLYDDGFKVRSWLDKALRFGKPVIISEIGIMPFNECLQNAGATGRGVTAHENTKVPEWYFKAFLNSGTLDYISEAWTWYNEFSSPEVDTLWKRYNKVIY